MRSLPWFSFIFVRSSYFLFSISGRLCWSVRTGHIFSSVAGHWAAMAGNGAASAAWLKAASLARHTRGGLLNQSPYLNLT